MYMYMFHFIPTRISSTTRLVFLPFIRFDDVVVGAPMYSRITSRAVQEEVGRVYVFMNTQVSMCMYTCMCLWGGGVGWVTFLGGCTHVYCCDEEMCLSNHGTCTVCTVTWSAFPCRMMHLERELCTCTCCKMS